MTALLKDTFDRKKQFASKRQAVIVEAGQAFRRRGYHNASMTEIAANLGLTKAALYYYVRNKEEVLYECHLMAYDAMDRILKAKYNGVTALDKLEALFVEFVKMLTASGVSLLTDVNSLGAENKADVLARRGKIERKIIRLVREGQKDGSIRDGDARLHVFFFMGALNWLNAWYDASGRLNGEDIAAHFALQMRAGIGS
ncbi:TetR/AcrR family transcriptional regulator [Hellea balneolensis]|uniref:TetR/AcrR family transcriptional regulator n=1 Tax=Hellea balneolensis TaxID=287478 RepID=UPI0004053C7E|nr:TetR/AcrR family transcriptional regulator [Hellea balneolensis]